MHAPWVQVLSWQAKLILYHTEFPDHILHANHPMCHLEALNAVAALTTWASQLQGKLVHLFCDNDTAVSSLRSATTGIPFFKRVLASCHYSTPKMT